VSKLALVYPGFERHADAHPELRTFVPMQEYLGSPSLGLATVAALTPQSWDVAYVDDRLTPAEDAAKDADLVAMSFFTPAASRALELADHYRAQGKKVVAGGIFPSLNPDIVADHVDAVVVGEAEGAWGQVVADFEKGALAPRYTAAPVDLQDAPVPDVSIYLDAERDGFRPDDYPVQSSRGCPLSCRACALPKSMGNSIRPLPIEHVLAQLKQLGAQGKRACLTEDTSWLPGRNSRGMLERLLDHLAEDDSGPVISYIGVSMPMILGCPPRLLNKVREAGVSMFYLVGGFDPITMKAFTGQHPKARQRAVDAIQRAFDFGIEPYTSFLLGGDQDDEGTVDRMLAFADETKIRKAEFAIATPYPGTPWWQELEDAGRILTREWRLYNDANVVFQPAQMSPEALTEGYLRLWKEFYATRGWWTDQSNYERTIQF
jgi:radical SAM superfamily enzyme YgiQ (UPF0313 family)